MKTRDKAPGNCRCCSAIFIRLARQQSSLKALQIAYPLRPIRKRLANDRAGGRAINFHYFIVGASFVSATSGNAILERKGGCLSVSKRKKPQRGAPDFVSLPLSLLRPILTRPPLARLAFQIVPSPPPRSHLRCS